MCSNTFFLCFVGVFADDSICFFVILCSFFGFCMCLSSPNID